MLDVVHSFQEWVGKTKLVIVSDAAMLSKDNMQKLEEEKYRYIVGARLANTSIRFIDQIHKELPRTYVEQAFRMSKSDLKARPIFHNRQEAI